MGSNPTRCWAFIPFFYLFSISIILFIILSIINILKRNWQITVFIIYGFLFLSLRCFNFKLFSIDFILFISNIGICKYLLISYFSLFSIWFLFKIRSICYYLPFSWLRQFIILVLFLVSNFILLNFPYFILRQVPIFNRSFRLSCFNNFQ